MAFPKFLKAAKADAFPVVAEGDTTNTAGFVITEDQANATEAALSAADTEADNNQTRIAGLQAELATANTERQTAATNLATATEQVNNLTAQLNTANSTIAALQNKTKDIKQTDKKEDEFAAGKKVVGEDSFDAFAKAVGL